MLPVVVAVIAAGGCRRDVRLAGRTIPHAAVHAVTLYGVTLDESASPQQVAYVALLAVREDFLAGDEPEREAALAKQFDLCAADVIASRNRTSTDRDEFIYNVVYHWTPTVSHYVHDFPADWEAAKARLKLRAGSPTKNANDDVEEAVVLMEVDDPSRDVNARVVLAVYLAKDGGMWRVLHLGFEPGRRSIP